MKNERKNNKKLKTRGKTQMKNIYKRLTSKKQDNLEKTIEALLTDMESLDSDSEEYSKAVKNLDTLCSARSKGKSKGISPDTVFIGLLGLLEVIAMLEWERIGNVISTKALGRIIKGRVQ